MIPTRRPQISSKRARQLAEDHYGLTVAARELPAYDDRNFLLEETSGRRTVLKISVASQRSAVELQLGALLHLEQQSTEFQLPRLCLTADGSSLAEVEDEADTECVLRLLTFVEGRQMADLGQYSRDYLFAFGGALAALDKALANFADPSATREFEWDLRHAAKTSEHIAAIAASEDRALAEYFLGQFRALAQPRLATLRQSVIHCDANTHNVLVDSDGNLAGFIDFGDLVKTNVVCEPAIAAAYAMLGQTDPLAVASQLIAGYHGVSPLEEAEIAILFPLICARLSVSVILGARASQLEPDNAHVAISAPAAWALLRQLRAIAPREAEERFRTASQGTRRRPIPLRQPG